MTQFVKSGLFLPLALAGAALLSANALAQGLNNPLNRNPQDRSSVPDTATVTQDARDSSTRPTLPAAPSQPDPRNADRAPRGPARFTRVAPVRPVDRPAAMTPAASAPSAVPPRY